MPSRGLSAAIAAIPSWLRGLPDLVQLVLFIATIGALLMGTVKAGVQVPEKLDAHMRQSDTVIYELRQQRKLQRAQLCAITERSRAEASACVARELAP